MASLWDTMISEDHLSIHPIAPRKYSVRTKRLSGCNYHKNFLQFQRRSSEASPLLTSNNYNHQVSQQQQQQQQQHNHWIFSSPESTSSTGSSTKRISVHSPSSTSTTAASSSRYLLSTPRKTERRASDRGPTSSTSTLSACTAASYSPMSPVPSPSTFHLGVSKGCQNISEVQSSSSAPLPLPPVVERFDMAGSPFLPTSYHIDEEQCSSTVALNGTTTPMVGAGAQVRHLLYAATTRGAGHHGIKAALLSRATTSTTTTTGNSNGGGSGLLPSTSSSSVTDPMSSSTLAKMMMTSSSHAQELESNDDGDHNNCDDEMTPANILQPSSYTFRRRNAIVEGSEDAPKRSVFSDSYSSGSE
ncbi:hypothetical protein BG004_000282 [Podila humilis]|nr:hypothetical protein BG004_000282 [Podila humilis]